jgi:hypothetical protein
MVDPYETLGVTKDADLSAIKFAYRKLILKCHPDRVKHLEAKQNTPDEFYRVQSAYEILKDDTRRRHYDERNRRVAVTTFASNHHLARRDRGILVLEGWINGVHVSAIPDTGAERSLMAASFAKYVGLVIQLEPAGKETCLQMANGKHIRAIGVVHARLRLKGNPLKLWVWTFTILADCVFDILIGDDFLRPNHIMSTNKSYLSRKMRPRNALSIRNVNILGSPSQRLSGTLNNEPVPALPDSGVELNLVSYAYARSRGWLTRIVGIVNISSSLPMGA